MGAVATFDYAAWQRRYPEFGAVTEPQAQDFFTEATLYLRNDGTGPVRDPAQQLMLLNMLVAHIAALAPAPGADGSASGGIVGRIASATEGSVSVTAAEMPDEGSLAAYFQQTSYGLAYWAATAGLRMARYIPGPRRGCAHYGRGGW